MRLVLIGSVHLTASIDYNRHKLVVQKRSIPLLPVATGAALTYKLVSGRICPGGVVHCACSKTDTPTAGLPQSILSALHSLQVIYCSWQADAGSFLHSSCKIQFLHLDVVRGYIAMHCRPKRTRRL